MYCKAQVSILEAMSSTNQWCVPDEMHDVLPVDFERSLTGLEVDLCTTSNSINSSVFAVPEISVRKEETRSSNSHGPEKCEIECYPVSLVHGKKIRYTQLSDIECSNGVKRFCFNKETDHSENFQTSRCRPHSLSAPELRTTSSHFYSSGSVINTILSQVVQLPVLPVSQATDQGIQGPQFPIFCVLLASTSISTKVSEETLTYLNQGQPYEIRLRKTGSFPQEKHDLLKSIIHVGFQERRLQYIEKEQIKEWQSLRANDRILEIDLPLSYGILEANNCFNINECEFLWDPSHDVGVFVKVNCISTEFTAKKHGGEKGVPFRILIETYSHNSPSEKLHAASCQVKVFKPKGADRKHKTDRDKMCRRLQSDKEKYHPQFEYTVFRDLSITDVWTSTHNSTTYTSAQISTPSSPISSGCSSQSPPSNFLLDSQKGEFYDSFQATSTTEPQEIQDDPEKSFYLTHESSPAECAMWLQKNMFNNYVKDFADFTGADFLNLTRADLIDICGVASGIRLYNTLHGKSYLTTYVRLPAQKAYNAIYLKTAKAQEFCAKIKAFCGFPADYNCEFYVSGPSGTRVILTDEVVCNKLKDSLFVIECMEGQYEEPYCVLLKHMTN